MCGVIGFKSSNIQSSKVLKNLILESKIRGKHATGISYITGDVITTIRSPVDSHQFIEAHWGGILSDFKNHGSINAIAHTRYSTSDLEYNQPIFNEHTSIVMNGVITQSSPDKWEEEFGVKCAGKNDTEIALRYLEQYKSPLELIETHKGSSMSVCQLHQSGDLFFYRNGTRPQYYYEDKDLVFVASTKDIIKRATGITDVHKTTPNQIFIVNGNNKVSHHIDPRMKLLTNTQKDLQ